MKKALILCIIFKLVFYVKAIVDLCEGGIGKCGEIEGSKSDSVVHHV